MTTPTSPERRLHARGFVLSDQTWGTAEALGATDEVLLEGPSGLDVPVRTVDPALESDTPFIKRSDILNIPPQDIVLPVRMRYEFGALGRAIAMLFGTAGNPTQVADLAYSSTLRWKEDNSGLFGTWAEERMGKIFEAASAKPQKLELSFSDGMLKGAMTLRCDSCIDDSAVNAVNDTLDSLTLPANFYNNGIVPMFSHASVFMNAESGGEVTSETTLVLDDFNLVFERPLEAGVHASGSETIIEPIQEGISGLGIEVTLSFPRMTTVNDDFFQTFAAETTQKLLIALVGPILTGATNYCLYFYYPRLKIISVQYPDEAIVKAGIVLRAEEAAQNPTGMTGAVPYLYVINYNQVDYLD